MTTRDRWPITEDVAVALAASRAEFAALAKERSAELDRSRGRISYAQTRASVERLEATATLPWPHADDLVAAARALLGSVQLTPGSALTDAEPAVHLGEGAFRAATAHGAQDRERRRLADLTVPCYLDTFGAVDEVTVKARGEVLARDFVPAREYRLDAAGRAVYRALRRDGHGPTDAADRATLATAAPA